MKFAGLVLNQRGMERFLSSGLDVATVAVSCTESHSRANCKMSIEDAIKTTSRILTAAEKALRCELMRPWHLVAHLKTSLNQLWSTR